MADEDVKQVVAENIRTLLNYAADNKLPYADAKALAKRAGLTGTTVGRWLKQENAAQIDKLDQVARVFTLRAWQLLIPNLDPSNPPAVPYTDVERRLYWRIKAAARELQLGSVVDESEGVSGAGPGHDSDSEGATGRPREVKKQ